MSETKDIEEAEAHVDWYLGSIRPLLLTFYLHGKKHGKEEGVK